jgi:hypothetical protein
MTEIEVMMQVPTKMGLKVAKNRKAHLNLKTNLISKTYKNNFFLVGTTLKKVCEYSNLKSYQVGFAIIVFFRLVRGQLL